MCRENKQVEEVVKHPGLELISVVSGVHQNTVHFCVKSIEKLRYSWRTACVLCLDLTEN